jgi:hypothetical protein
VGSVSAPARRIPVAARTPAGRARERLAKGVWMPTIVLRFRDLPKPTIPEHASVIRDTGSVWWGWWSLPGEAPIPAPDRTKVPSYHADTSQRAWFELSDIREEDVADLEAAERSTSAGGGGAT